MKQKLFFLATTMFCTIAATAQNVKAIWQFSDAENLSAYTMEGEQQYTALLTPSYALGTNITVSATLTGSNADTGYETVTYSPPFTALTPTVKVDAATAGNNLAMGLTPANGHSFKPTKISFDACRVGTDAGGIVVKMKESGGTEIELGAVTPLRNKITKDNSTGYSHHEMYVNDFVVKDKAIILMIYITGTATNKAMALRNICIEGELDGKIMTAGDYLSSLTFTGATTSDGTNTLSLLPTIKELRNGQNARFSTKLSAEPTDFKATLNSTFSDHSVEVSYADRTATVSIKQQEQLKFTCSASFSVSTHVQKPEAKPLKRGLMALHQSNGNLVSWRSHKADDRNVRFRLWRGTTAEKQTTKVNNGKLISGKTNFLDGAASANSYYRLEVVDANGEVIESEVSGKTWADQTMRIPLTGGAPTDPSGQNATYTPNDASFCDMDGDGEYEIILKWSPSNEKDAASNGSTSNVFFDCYKMDGTRLWRIDMGQNFFASAHTIQFIAWDFDGDGYGEFMVKTAPGTKDGQGNYVLLGNDDPTANLKSSRGKQDHGSEYITVFDGQTGAELATIPYHTDYAKGEAYWGDSKQNRSERYLAAIAWLDGEDANPSPIFARGYYSGAFVAAYDWDGTTLKERWVSRNITSGKGLWGEGAHWLSVGDCNGDGKQDIVYGSAALKSDGTLLYRTGLGHGDALHLGDFDPDNEGLEVFMAHEKSPYGVDLRDARTGKLLQHPTAGGDTGRGIIGHFNPESEGSYFQSSAGAGLYDWNGKTIAENITHGGGGSLNNRIYWNGTLADQFYDKSVLEAYNHASNRLDRMQVNGGNYTIGTLNNSSKYNPCILGDMLGDWREEIVTWEESNGQFNLIVNATNYPTDYIVPHLMDDPNYRAQVINQNVCYNQPPHLSYDLRNSKKIVRHPFEVESTAGKEGRGKYWDCFYTTYPVIIPENLTAWKVSSRTVGEDTIKTTKLNAGTILPANSGIIYSTNLSKVTFVPTTRTASTMTGSTIKGDYCDSTLVSTSANKGFYQFRHGERGLGFYRAEGSIVTGGTGFVYLTGTTANPLADSYILGYDINPSVPTAIENVNINIQDKQKIYSLDGIQQNSTPKHGIYIQNGKKIVR